MNPLPYGRQTIEADDLDAVRDALTDEFLTTGPRILAFETAFAARVGARHAVAVANGTAALHLACLAAEIGPGDEVITSPLTFCASANCALYCGAIPVFADVTTERGLIDPAQVERRITPRTKAIIPVHYAGFVCDLAAIRRIAQRHRLTVIEDACHALGASDAHGPVGNCAASDLAVFSFHPVKHITTGEGGMITTNSDALAARLRRLRSHGLEKVPDQLAREGPWYQEMSELGYNYRLTDIQAALGTSQLAKLDRFLARRRALARRYDEAFARLRGVRALPTSVGAAYHLYVIRTAPGQRRALFEGLAARGIRCQVHYVPVYWSPVYERRGHARGECPRAEGFYGEILSLPLYPLLSDEEQARVIAAVRELA